MREVPARLQAETTFLLLRVNKIGCWQNLKRSRLLMHGSNGKGKAKILMIGRPGGNDLPPINAHIVHLQDSSSFTTPFERRAAAPLSTVTSTAQPVDIDDTPRRCTQASQMSSPCDSRRRSKTLALPLLQQAPVGSLVQIMLKLSQMNPSKST